MSSRFRVFESLLGILTFAAFAPAFAAEGPLPDRPHVYVEGSGQVEFEPDTLEVNLVYSEIAADVATAKQKVDEQSRGFLRACAALGIASRDVGASDLRTEDEYDYRDDKRILLGTRVTRSVAVTLRDLSKYAALMRAVFASNVSNIGGSSLSSKADAEMIAKAHALAVEDARRRADNLATAANRKLGPVYSISEFALRQEESFRLQPSRAIYAKGESGGSVRANMMSAPANTEVFEPGTITARASAYVVYLLTDDTNTP